MRAFRSGVELRVVLVLLPISIGSFFRHFCRLLLLKYVVVGIVPPTRDCSKRLFLSIQSDLVASLAALWFSRLPADFALREVVGLKGGGVLRRMFTEYSA